MVDRWTADDYWRPPLLISSDPEPYAFLQTNHTGKTIKAMLILRRAFNDMPVTKATYRLTKVLEPYGDITPKHVPNAALWMLGSWPVPPVISRSNPQKYVNPHYTHRSEYADVYFECRCGVVLDVCPAARYSGGESSGHESNYHRDGCEKWEQIHARAMLHEIRYDIVISGLRMGKSFRAMSDRLGLSEDSVRASLFNWGADRAQEERSIGRQKLAETYRQLHVEDDYTKADLGKIFPHTPGTIKEYISRYTDAEHDGRRNPRTPVTLDD